MSASTSHDSLSLQDNILTQAEQLEQTIYDDKRKLCSLTMAGDFVKLQQDTLAGQSWSKSLTWGDCRKEDASWYLTDQEERYQREIAQTKAKIDTLETSLDSLSNSPDITPTELSGIAALRAVYAQKPVTPQIGCETTVPDTDDRPSFSVPFAHSGYLAAQQTAYSSVVLARQEFALARQTAQMRHCARQLCTEGTHFASGTTSEEMSTRYQLRQAKGHWLQVRRHGYSLDWRLPAVARSMISVLAPDFDIFQDEMDGDTNRGSSPPQA